MADAAVQFLVENLLQLLRDNAELIFGIKEQAESLLGDLGDFKAFLKEAARRRSQNEVIKELVKKIRIAVNKAEDAIDKFVVEAKLHRSKGMMTRYVDKPAHLVKVNAAAREIESIRNEVRAIRQNNAYGLQALQMDNASKDAAERKAPVVEEDDVVGFDGEAKTIIDRLIGGSDDLEVVSIFGMPGLGKTTLARKVFKDSEIEYEFFTRHWVYVSRSYNRKDIFLNILSIFTQRTKDYHDMTEEQLAEKISKFLESGKYLIVLDDVWEEKDWKLLKIAFPNNKKKSRVLLTTRQGNVASRATSNGQPHDLKFLSHDESFELLEKKVCRKQSCPSELKAIGLRIAIKCDGLPLAIVVIAGVLLDKGDRRGEWEMVAECVSTYVNKDEENCKKLVEMSYDHLPYDLKSCFLYFGAFPGGYEIPAWKLIRLWIAEGFIQNQGQLTLEDIAEGYLNDLVNRNLVIVMKKRIDGRIKTCRMHDMLHEFCKNEAREDNLLREIRMGGNEPFPSPGELNTYRRLCVHSHVLDFIRASRACGEHVRSFLCFSSKEIELPLEHIQAIPKAYKLLRVLEMKPILLTRFPREMTQLFHLRYIALSSDIKIIPPSIGNLWNMQTLIIETSQRSLEIKADIWSMQRFRHLHTNTCTNLPSPLASKSSKDRLITGSLNTLSTISPESCTEEVLTRTPNLTKLGIRGKLSSLMESKGPSMLFDNLGKLDHLENLKLLNDVFLGQTGKLRGLPQAYKFPSKLKKLTISNTSLEWKDMTILGTLENLEVLKLDDNAFKGEIWEPVNGGFRHLQVFCIGRTDLASWQASSHHFPRLKFLALRHCNKLEAVPFGLADIPSLQMMELYCTNKIAAESARKIQQHKPKSGGFKLSIYPPDH
ncbi:PREDICTED: putative late blight resistance protein homolog R1B-16 [Ipomoea nil]|uniref:putative late blight resistance protein homolog R1B-16 n=1 Tax=Ipomoea nil TaxID=35883 RepID=UPI0009016F3D|nr:PREDICTED: putative late blight resistance protein homolog R1B-16 [Ipomoea nil]XP_019164862.1 PREDICTED: putative late blight resistance protein homolog R1B-16 [Ipomoea nil]